MWRLKIAEAAGPWLRSKNNHVGRQFEEIGEVERLREAFRDNRFDQRSSADLIMPMQFEKENPLEMKYHMIKIQDNEDVSEDVVVTSLRKAISRISTLQPHDGHWPWN